MLYSWRCWARPKQLVPLAAFVIWLILSGRGWGKTRTGAEFVRERVENGARRIALVGETKADVRDTMIELGDSSILKTSPPWENIDYQPSKRRVIWYNEDNTIKAMGIAYSGDEPDQLRGPQHDTAWVDELAKYRYPELTWDNLEMGLRLGEDPKAIVTTTPRPIKIIKKLVEDPDCIVTKGHTKDNLVNLAGAFVKRIYGKYAGTRLGRQELAGQILDDNPNSLWSRKKIDELRVNDFPELKRLVVAVDPPGGHKKENAECGIVCAGIGHNDHAYILDDDSLRAKPDQWGRVAVNCYTRREADRIVAEINYGGDMVEAIIKTINNNVSFGKVRATRGKTLRAEPISALYEQGKVHHVGCFQKLEDQMCEWDPNIPDREQESPDRMDALVWALTELMLESTPEFFIGKA